MALRAAVVLVVLLWVGVAAVAAARANVRARADERRLAPAYIEREGRVAQMPLTMDADQAPVPIDGAVHPFMALATLPYQQAYFDVLNRAVTPPVVNSLPPAAPTFAVGQSVNPFRPGSPFYSPARGTSFGPNAVYGPAALRSSSIPLGWGGGFEAPVVPLAPAAPVIASTSPFADVNDSPTGTAFDTPPSAAGILVPAHSLHPFADDGQFYALLESHEGGAAQRSFHIEHCSGCAFA